VTYGFIGVLIAVCLLKVEAWPLTSVHLFSSVRTADSIGLELIAVSDDHRTRVHPGDTEVMSRTSHLFSKLPKIDDETQREMVEAWLKAAKIPLDDVDRVQLERVTRQMGDDSSQWLETERESVWELVL